MNSIKQRLDIEVKNRNHKNELSYERPDPLMVAKRFNEPYSALLCGVYAYGKASNIVKFLDSLDFSLIDADEEMIRKTLQKHYYRFQKPEDVIQSFITIRRMKLHVNIEELFYEAYRQEESVIDGLNALIEYILTCNTYNSHGYNFLFGKKIEKPKGNAPMKRWMMYLRWMVR